MPRFTHDCDHCIFVGQFGTADGYVCVGNTDTSVILRYGSDGPEYQSMSISLFAMVPPEHTGQYHQVVERATQLGLLK